MISKAAPPVAGENSVTTLVKPDRAPEESNGSPTHATESSSSATMKSGASVITASVDAKSGASGTTASVAVKHNRAPESAVSAQPTKRAGSRNPTPEGLKNHPALRVMASMWITVGILFTLGVACALATIIEAKAGTPAAQALVYRAHWFEGLIAIMIVNLIAMFVIRWPYRKARIGFVITHFAIIWILISAGITRYFGYEGYMPIREGTSTGLMYSREDYLQLEIGSTRAAIPVTLWKAGKQNLRRDLIFDSGKYRVEILEHWMRRQEDEPAVAHVRITDPAGEQAETMVRVRNADTPITLGDQRAWITIGPRRVDLPYRVHLDDFVLVTYPGSENPAGFESHVRVLDEARGIEGQPYRIVMNHPLTYRGFKHFQSSYDSDRKGTVLSVNHDPGKWPTYIGYILISLGFLITLTRGKLWMRQAHLTAIVIAVGLFAFQEPANAWPPEDGSSAGASTAAAAGASTDASATAPGAPASGASASSAVASASPAVPEKNFLSDEASNVLGRLIVQDYQGRMKPLDTYALEMVMKVTKKGKFEGWRPLDLYLSWMVHGDYWLEQPLLYVHHPGTKEILSIDPSIEHVVPATLWDAHGHYQIADEVESTLRTPAGERTKARSKLLSFDEELNLFLATTQGRTFRVFPMPGDANHAWTGPDELGQLESGTSEEYAAQFSELVESIQMDNDVAILQAAQVLHQTQVRHGSAVLPKETQLRAELTLNRLNPFVWVMLPYLITFLVLAMAYAWSLARRHGEKFPLRHPLYLLGWIPFVIGVGLHLYGYILRWIASGRAPLSNGYESLLFISLVTALAGVVYELRDRRGSAAALSALLSIILLGVAMLPTFDPAISPVVPVLASFWLIIHVSVITASYAFLGLAAFISMTVLLLHLFKGPGRTTIRNAIEEMNQLHWGILVTGVAFLSIGTLLGGVWANESWGRYWGWDPKETWALITIFLYGVVVHFRFVEKLNRPAVLAAGSFLCISSVVMTYFGVNYLLSGLHSYGSGESAGVPVWIYVAASSMVLLVLAGLRADATRSWRRVAH